MKGHFKTWLKWINELSPMSPKVSNTSLEDRELLAYALTLAAPQGPSGMVCLDECRCTDHVPQEAAMDIWNTLMSSRRVVGVSSTTVMEPIRQAINSDYANHRVRGMEIPAREICDVDVIVSQKNGDVAHARRLFPRTFDVVVRYAKAR